MNGLRRNDAEELPEAGTKKMPLVSIVILNWNGKEFLRKFLPLVIASSYANKRVIVADNASTDDSVDFLKESFPQVELLFNAVNEGFAKGYNTALRQVESDYYVLLNNDVEVTPGWIEPVIELMENDASIAACQPKMLSYQNRNYFEYAGAAGGWLDSLGYPFARGRIFETVEKDSGQYDAVQPCFWASGAAMFVKAAIYHALGGLDEYFFAHQEEIDFCWRLQLAGYKVYVQPASVVYHVGGGTLAKGNNLKTFLNFRNNLVMLAKNLPPGWAVRTIAARLPLDALAAWKAILKGDSGFFIAICKAHVHFANWLLLGKKTAVVRVARKAQWHGWYAGSVVWQHFIKKKNWFSEIVRNK
ncbi:MAG: glycosyltransferase family 2 protein [Ferruginibacter sp.]|nr:glycosyltransferase family 2 protein [Ferruginibacter sp.]